MTSPGRVALARCRWWVTYGALAIVAAYVGVLTHTGQAAVPGYIGMTLVAVLTWAAVEEALAAQPVGRARPSGATGPAQSPRAAMSMTKRYRTSLATTRS